MESPEQRRRTEVEPIAVRKVAYRERVEPTFATFAPIGRGYEALPAERGGVAT
jgi:hypothetical protein